MQTKTTVQQCSERCVPRTCPSAAPRAIRARAAIARRNAHNPTRPCSMAALNVAGAQRKRTAQRRIAARSSPTAPASPSSTACQDMRNLGSTDVRVPVIGLGACSWGDRTGFWGYGVEYGRDASLKAYQAIIKAFGEQAFIDTAEIYGYGKSEEFLGEFMRETGTQPQLATKFAPLPWRFDAAAVPSAARQSLQRLGLPKVSLYMQHFPGFLTNGWSNDAFLDGLVQVKQQGLADAVGVSNFTAKRLRDAATRLRRAGVNLASNQVQYNLLYRAPETSGIIEVCREFGITPIAYAPLSQGLLTGKYKPNGPKPFGMRAQIFNDKRTREIEPLISAMQAISKENGKTLVQIALNWCVCKGALPIPGVKNERQLADVAGAMHWRLKEGEVAELDRVSAQIPTNEGVPGSSFLGTL